MASRIKGITVEIGGDTTGLDKALKSVNSSIKTILANNGIKGAEGGTHLRNVILALQSPTDKATACMESLGVEVYDSEGNMRSLNDILTGLNTSMDGMTSAEKQNIISSIFNKTDLAAVNSLLVSTGDSWDSLQQSITESGGAAQQMADTKLDNLSGQITILKSALEGLAISFGEILMPKIRAAAKKVQEFVDKLNGMNDEQKETVVKIAAVVAAIGPMLILFGKIISTVGTAMKGFSGLTKGIAKLGVKIAGSSGSITGLGSALGAVAGPVLAVVAVIGTLAAAFATLWKTNDEFRENIIGTWNQIKETVSGFCQGIVDRLNSLGFEFESITEVLSAVWQGFCELLAPVFEGVFNHIAITLSTVLDVILGIVDVFISVFQGDWSGAWEAVKGIFTTMWEGLVSWFENILGTLKGVADVVLGWFGTNWDEVWNAVSTTFTNIWKEDEMVLTVHRWFANKSCPGDWLYSRLGDLAAKVTVTLGSASTEADPVPEHAKAELYRVRKTWADAKSQKGAYKILANAKKCADANPGYSVFDSKGTLVYPEHYRVHTVVHGDTLWKIAAQYLGDGSRYKEIVSLNGLSSNVIYSGQKLKIPN